MRRTSSCHGAFEVRIRITAIIVLPLLTLSCAGPDPGAGSLEPAGTLVPDEILECRGDRDGVIDADELPLLAGVTAHQRVHESVAISSAGLQGDNGLEWVMPEGGEIVDIATEPLDGFWFADEFPPDASYAVATNPTDPPSEQILGVYRVEEEAVMLLGLASREPDSPAGGLLTPYDEPVMVLRFPVVLGDSWEAIGVVSAGSVGGATYVAEDSYAITVDGRGTVTTEDAIIRDALRLSVRLTIRTPAFDPIERLELIWYRECVGEVARLTPNDGDIGPEVDHAAELRTLAF